MKRALGWRPVRLVLERDGRVAGAGQFLIYRTPLVPGALMYCPKGPGVPASDKMSEDHPLYGVYKWKVTFGGEVADFLGYLDLPVRRARTGLWDRVEPVYFGLHRRLKGNVYY